MTALRAAASYVFIDDAGAQRLLEGEAPRLLTRYRVAVVPVVKAALGD